MVLDGRRPKPQIHEDGSWHTNSEDFWEWWDEETTFTIVCANQLQKIHLLQEMTKKKCPDPLLLATPQMAERLYLNERKKSAYVTGMTDKFGQNEPHDFNMLLQIHGFCHGSAVWSEFYLGNDKQLSSNGESLVAQGRASFREIPAFREDIWTDISSALVRNEIRDNGLALQMMEDARLGRYYHKGMPKEYETMLLSLGLPEWYPEYLKKVMHLFPKGHCVSLMILDIILEWYAQEFPKEYSEVSKLDVAFEVSTISQ